MSQAMMAGAISQAQMQAVQMQYLANMQAQQNMMLQQQQIQQQQQQYQQQQQKLAIRQAKKKAAAEKTVNVSYKGKLTRPAKTIKPTTTNGPSV